MRADRRANVAVITALCALPLFGMMGLAIDYASAVQTKAKLDTAADAAVVAAITKAKSVIAGGGSTSAAIAQGQDQGAKAFAANVGALSFAQKTPVPTVTITPSADGRMLNASVAYGAANTNQFAQLFHVASTNLVGTSSSSTVITPYYQFIFVVDVSGSMAIGGTDADIKALTSTLGCAFACHNPDLNSRVTSNGKPIDPREMIRNKITLKIDYVNQAIQKFIYGLKNKTANMSGVFTVGIDTFGSYFNPILNPTSDLAAAQIKASKIDVEAEQMTNVNQGYTETTSGLLHALSLVNNIGDGTSPQSQSTYFIFLSDGIEDIYNNPGVIYNRKTDVDYTSVCTQIKKTGATLISIAAPYPTISLAQDPDHQYELLIQPFQPPALTKPRSMTAAMQNCATPDPDNKWAFVATDGPAIDTAVQTALNNILSGMTRLTQ